MASLPPAWYRVWTMRPLRRPVTRAGHAARPLLYVVATVVALAAHLLGLGHMAIVAHARCEHGELVHGEHEHEAGAAARSSEAAPGAPSSAGPSPAVDPGGASDDHEHCDPFAVMPATVSVTAACGDVTLLDAGLLPWSVRASAGTRVQSILSLAPKSSPPV